MRASLGVVCLFLLAAPPPCWATDYRLPPDMDLEEEGLELTSWLRFKPFARFGTTYTTNVSQESNADKEEDTIFQLQGGGDFVLGSESDYFSVGYVPSVVLYAKNPKLNSDEHRLRYDAQAQLTKLTLTSSGHGAWANTNTDPQFAGQVRNFSGAFQVKSEWQPTDLLGLDVEGDADYLRFYSAPYELSNVANWRAGIYPHVTPSTDFPLQGEVGFYYRQIRYTHTDATNPDLDIVGGTVGLRVGNDLVTARGRVGYEVSWVRVRRDYAYSEEPPEGLVLDLQLLFNIQDTTRLDAHLLRQIRFASSADYLEYFEVGGGLEQEIPFLDLTARCSYTWSVQTPDDAPDLRTHSYLLGLGWEPVFWLELGAQVTYLHAESSAGGYEVFTAGGSLTLRY